MTQAYIEGFSKTAEAYGVDPETLKKVAGILNRAAESAFRPVSYLDHDVSDNASDYGWRTAGGTNAFYPGLAGLSAIPAGGAIAMAGLPHVGLPIAAGGAGLYAGTAARVAADKATGGAVSRGLEHVGDKAGRLIGTALQKLNNLKQYHSRPPMAFNTYTGRYRRMPSSKR